jgi:hypothetical protein
LILDAVRPTNYRREMALLAYLFWHSHRPDGDPAGYEQALAEFHGELAAAAPAGFHGSTAFAVEGATWMREPLYEDWYMVDDWAAVGTLNEAAVDARRRASHDAVAASARAGAGGVYMMRAGAEPLAADGTALWLDKPAGVPYASFRERMARLVAEEGCVWERQLVLGPAPEYCAVTSAGAAAAPVAATVVKRRRICTVTAA